ncbi:MAG: transketolase [Sedimentibacter sp.]|uniref:transketolase n=1 Tax=Sedimentibacter sp. TaxID=1960295 RepID=UPI002981EF46|nr:transketolase [Sedimentibacter sp.]MDW5299291.1 transketolase [Sedimentibacter sp.]
MNNEDMKVVAQNIRKNILTMIHEAKSGHPGGSLSAVEIMTYLYYKEMNIVDCKDENRDRFVLSKGHGAPALYSVLMEKGFIGKDLIGTLRQVNSKLQGHPDMRKVPGVEASTGSLGQGLSIANGMALAFKLDKKENRVFVLIGDGEMQEGMIWEAAMLANHYKLDNVTAILDHNGLQIDGRNSDVMTIEPIDEKWRAFGWHVIKADGHDFNSLEKAFEERKTVNGKPAVIIAETTKGKGCSFMEDKASWHGKAPNDEEFCTAMEEIGGGLNV